MDDEIKIKPTKSLLPIVIMLSAAIIYTSNANTGSILMQLSDVQLKQLEQTTALALQATALAQQKDMLAAIDLKFNGILFAGGILSVLLVGLKTRPITR